MRRALMGLVVLAVCGMMMIPVVLIDKQVGIAAAEEPTGTIPLDDSKLQLAITSDDYLRLYDWDSATGQFTHEWSGTGAGKMIGGCALGDLDNDGSKELAGFRVYSQIVSKKQTINTYYLDIWDTGAASDKPTYSTTISSVAANGAMKIGNVDSDSGNELVLKTGWDDIEIWDFSYDANKKITSETNKYTSKISKAGDYGFTVANCDSDSVMEIVVGSAYDDDGVYNGKAVVIDYQSGSYVRAAYLGYRGVDDVSVGDLDGDATNGNEIFMSGAMSGDTGMKVCIWRYNGNGYGEVWSGEYELCPAFDYLQSNEIADIDGDGNNEAIAGTEAWNERVKGKVVWYYRLFVWVYDGVDDTWIKSSHDVSHCGGQVDALVSADLDGDDNHDAELVFNGAVLDWDYANHCLETIQSLPYGKTNYIG
jgi:hypothetical protein